MKTLASSSSSPRSSWIKFRKFCSNSRPLVKTMKKGRLAELCCTGDAGARSDIEERPMVSPGATCSGSSSNGSSSSSTSYSSSSCSGSVVQEWRDMGEMKTNKRVMVVVDESREARTALLWALSHVVQKLDVVTLLYVMHSNASYYYDTEDSRSIVPDKTRLRCEEKGCELTSSLKSLCALRQPEVDVEVVAVAGEKGPTIVRQAKKLDVSILVLGQSKLNFFQRCLRWSKDDQLVDYCIQHADCLTLSVRRKSKQCGGYLINSKWQRNFWLLA